MNPFLPKIPPRFELFDAARHSPSQLFKFGGVKYAQVAEYEWKSENQAFVVSEAYKSAPFELRHIILGTNHT